MYEQITHLRKTNRLSPRMRKENHWFFLGCSTQVSMKIYNCIVFNGWADVIWIQLPVSEHFLSTTIHSVNHFTPKQLNNQQLSCCFILQVETYI